MRDPRRSLVPGLRTRSTSPALPVAIVALSLLACRAERDETRAAGPTVIDPSAFQVFATDDAIATVEDLAVLGDGRIWVLNSVEPLLLGFGPGGEPLASGGRIGGGPNEFGALAGFLADGWEGEAWVLDRRRHALIRASTGAGPRAEIPLPRDAIPPGSVIGGAGVLGTGIRTARLGDAVVLPRRVGSGELAATAYWTALFEAELVALDPETGSVRTVVSLPRVLGDLGAHFEEVSGGFPPFPLWFRLWAVCPGGTEDRVWLYDFVRDALRGFGPDGTEVDSIEVRPPFTSVTPREFARAAFDLAVAEAAGAVTPGMGDMSAADSARILDAIMPRIEGTPEQLAAVLPKYVDFRCGDDGTMWLRPLDLERGGMEGGPVWLRIAGDGEPDEVRFPDRFDPFRFTSGRVWGVLRDELDIAAIAWVETPDGS